MGSCLSNNKTSDRVAPKHKNLVQNTAAMLNQRLLIKGQLNNSAEALAQEKKTNDRSINLTGLSELSKVGLGVSCLCGSGINNQDDFILIADPSFTLVGVFDGHGSYGDKVADYVKTILPKLIVSAQNEQEITDAFLETNRRLIRRSINRTINFSCKKSGTTATIGYIIGRNLYVANVGNSRAILGIKNGSKYKAHRLTNDHRPDLPDEERRIIKAGGELRYFLNEHIPRVFAKDSNQPGINLSRIIGDNCAQKLGVIAEPEVSKIEITCDLEYLVICSDGIWDMVSDQEVVNMVSPLGNQSKLAADTITFNAQKKSKEIQRDIDDMTALVVYLPWHKF